MARELATLVVKVTADTVEVRTAFSRLTDEAEKTKDKFAQISAMSIAAGNVLSTAFTKAVGYAIDALKGLGGELLKGIKLSGEYNSAMIGLIGVSRAFGMSSDAAMAAAKGLSKDGLLPLGDSAKGLKNLLMTGFGLKESTDIMNVFKDAAVHGRQANFGYAESIVTASEGVKNMLSRQVDNVGITKNLSVIMAEQGYKMQDLTDKVKGAGARQALYNGLLREGAAMSGDAARSLGTYTGAMAALDSSYKSALASIGNFVTTSGTVGLALQIVGQWLRDVTDWLNRSKAGYTIVTDAIILFAKALSYLLDMADLAQTVFTALQNAFNDVASAVSKAVILLLKATKIANEIGKYTDPIQEASTHIYTTRAKEAADAITFLEGAVKGFGDATHDNIDRSNKWGNAIQEVRAKVMAVIPQLEATRGKVIDLGEAARPAGQAIDRFGGQVDKSKKAAKELKDDLAALKHAFDMLLPAEEKHREAVRARLEQTMKDSQEAKLELINLTKNPLPMFPERMLPSQEPFATPFQKRQQTFFKDQAAAMTDLAKRMKEQAKVIEDANPFGKTFRGAVASALGDLPVAMANAFAKGESVALAGGATIANAFGASFRKALDRQAREGGAFTASEKLTGKIAAAAQGAMAGIETGLATASIGKGMLSGAATGAMAGMVLGPAGAAIGAGVGAIGGLIGGIFGKKKKAAEDLAEINKQKAALIEQYGSYANLKKVADDLGVSLDKTWNTKKLSEFTAGMGALNKALEDQKARMEALGSAVTAVNKRAELLAAPFLALQETIKKAGEEGASSADKIAGSDAQKKMLETAQRSQGAFEMLGLTVRDTFAGLVKENGNAIAAINALTPAFTVLQQGVEQFGLTSTTVVDNLIADFKLVNDEAFKPLFDTIQADGAILQSLFDAKALSPDTFQALAADIGASIQGIVDKGGDMSRTLALSQPVLQTLWEAQQRYGTITDETTASILKQAEEQGLVGEAMKSVNEKILDVLLAIGKVLGADLPDYFAKLVPAAENAASGVENALNNIKPDPITLKVNTEGADIPAGSVPTYGSGGIVRHRTLAIIGESGPEAIVPLSGNSALGVSGGTYQTDVYLDGERIARSTAKRMPNVLRGVGVN